MRNQIGWTVVALLALASETGVGQLVEIHRNPVPRAPGLVGLREEPEPPVQLFGRSGLDMFLQGPAQASTQLVRLRIGERQGFSVPLYFFVGAAGNAFGKEKHLNETTAASVLNPLGGTLNLSVNNSHRVWKTGTYTSLRIAYHVAARLASGRDTSAGDETAVLMTAYADLGVLFQTAAWDLADPAETGVFWFQAKITGVAGSRDSFRKVFGSDLGGRFAGYAVDLGVLIKGRVNLKVGAAGAWNLPAGTAFEDAIVRLSFDYKVKTSE